MSGRISVSAEIVGIGSDGTEPSIVFALHRHGVFSADKTLLKRYLFNCGEGTQRLCGENCIKLNSLDAIFLTRLDVPATSGIPGMVFALGGLGAARMSIHGPQGTLGRLGAMRSFVRRRYPQMECAVVEPWQTGSLSRRAIDNDMADDPATDIMLRKWAPGSVQEDPYARIVALPLTLPHQAREDEPYKNCWICAKCPPWESKKTETARHKPHASGDTEEEDEEDPDRKWLRFFYLSKGLADKVAHMDAILRKYRGRVDELKTQLVAKYGSLATPQSSSPSSSSSSSSSEEEEEEEEKMQSSEDKEEVSTGNAGPLNAKWLTAFYKKHEPAKVARVDQILRQFAGREEALRSMLLSKYSGQLVETPPAKKQKLMSGASATEEIQPPPQEIPAVYVEKEDEASRPESPRADDKNGSSICYVVQFRCAPCFPVVWVVDCPSESHVASLLKLFPPPVGVTCGHRPVLVVHFSPPFVVRNPKYQAWMAAIQGDGDAADVVEHVVFDGKVLREVHGGVFSFAFLASARHFLKNQPRDVEAKEDALCRWTRLQHLLAIAESGSTVQERQQPVAARQLRILQRLGSHPKYYAHIAQALLSFTLENGKAIAEYSRTGWKQSTATATTEADDQDQNDETNGDAAAPAATQATQAIRSAAPVTIPRRLTILGTGSAAPSKLRASTSMYMTLATSSAEPLDLPVSVSVPGILIDCGEGTYGQLERRFDTEMQLSDAIAGLQLIWISHHHADHQCGILRVLDEYVRITTRTSTNILQQLFVVAPQSVLTYVHAWLPTLPPWIKLMTCAEMNDPSSQLQKELKTHVKQYISHLQSVRVWHCHDAYGLVLWLVDGTKIVYSGDTKPCEQLIRAGYDASLLIHEATFDDSMEEDADKKKHSTVGQAIEVARRMRAKQLVLTHFSQRYPSLPPPMSSSSAVEVSDARNFPMEISCAFDGFTIAL